jgi:SAM-dependent methyltransferase
MAPFPISIPNPNPPQSNNLSQHKYPCVGGFHFLRLQIAEQPIYPEILSRVGSGSLFLDLGCGVGQVIRQLVYDGAPGENLYGSDVQQGFLDIGYKLFRDQSSLKAHFFAADVYDESNPGFKEIEGKLEIIWASAFLHLFSWEGQVKAIKRMISLLKKEKNVVVAGRNLGHVKPGPISHAHAPQKTMYRHDAESFKELWRKAGEETGSNWDVSVESMKLERAIGPIGASCAWADSETIVFRFQARRL